jgi:hypothetical protein
MASTVGAVQIKKRGHNQRQPMTNKDFVYPWSFQMSLDELIDDNDQSYSGVQFSLSHFFNNRQAVRFNMGIADQNPAFDDRKIFRSDGARYVFEDYGNFDVTGVTFSIQGMFYSGPQGKPRLFWGLGPKLGISDANPDVWISYYDDPSIEYLVDYDDGTLISAGLEGAFGIEWFIGRNFSMVAEYGIALQNEWYILDFEYYDFRGHRYTESEVFDDGIHLDDSHIKLGVSFYF